MLSRAGDILGEAAVRLAESGRLPDQVLRWGIRRLCEQRLRDEVPGGAEARQRAVREFADGMRRATIAPVPEAANRQHYEVPAELFATVLGPRLKYSCCYWPAGVADLAAAEEAALAATCERAGLADGQQILDLGCGWGSLSLWAAAAYPAARITAVSNSAVQREWIEARAAERGLANLQVITADVNRLSLDSRFDRVVSVEMFEHMRNYEQLLARIAGWLAPGGRLLIHIFCHRAVPYAYEVDGAGDWMARYFFTGGIMPSDDLLRQFSRDLQVTRTWRWDGTHYQRTADAWLANLDRNHHRALAALRPGHGADAELWLNRWRLFFLGCSELFGFRNGLEWWVSHYLLEPAR